jgi:hypothetical protein
MLKAGLRLQRRKFMHKLQKLATATRTQAGGKLGLQLRMSSLQLYTKQFSTARQVQSGRSAVPAEPAPLSQAPRLQTIDDGYEVRFLDAQCVADGRLRRSRIGPDQRKHGELRGPDVEPRHERIVFPIGGELRTPEGIAETAVQRRGRDRFWGFRPMVMDHNHYDEAESSYGGRLSSAAISTRSHSR